MRKKAFNIPVLFVLMSGLLLSCTSGNINTSNSSNTQATYAYFIAFSRDESDNYFNRTLTYTSSGDGKLVPTNNAIINNDINAAAIVTNPKLPYAYIVNSDGGSEGGSIAMYNISSSGDLIPLEPLLVRTGFKPYSLTISSNGNYGYVANDDSTISMYSIVNGALLPLTPESTISEDFDSSMVLLTPNDKYAYANNLLNNTISMYNVLANGSLSLMSESNISTQAFPYYIAMHPSGKYLYSINRDGNSINMFSIDHSGILQPLQPESYIAINPLPKSMTINPAGTIAYVLNENNEILTYTINSSGVLQLLPNTSIRTGEGAFGFTIDPKGEYGYVTGFGDINMTIYSIANNGTLTQSSTESAGYFNDATPISLTFYTNGN